MAVSFCCEECGYRMCMCPRKPPLTAVTFDARPPEVIQEARIAELEARVTELGKRLGVVEDRSALELRVRRARDLAMASIYCPIT